MVFKKGHKHLEETKRKIGIAHLGKSSRIGLKHSEESRLKMRLAHLGRKLTEEHKDKISNAHKNKKLSEKQLQHIIELGHKNKGRIFSEEHRKKISEYNKGKTSWNKELKGEEYFKHYKEGNVYWKGKKLSNEHKEKMSLARQYIIMPLKDTSIEIKIQNYLKQLGIGFFTHVYMKEIEHGYQCDIFIPVQRNKDRFIREPIIIECDGDYIHCNPKFYPNPNFQRFPKGRDRRKAKDIWERDRIRTEQLKEKGFRVVRLWECEIKKINLNKFEEIINYEI